MSGIRFVDDKEYSGSQRVYFMVSAVALTLCACARACPDLLLFAISFGVFSGMTVVGPR